MITGGLHEYCRVAARRDIGMTDHGLTHGLMDAKRRTVELIAGAQFAVHLFGKKMKTGVVIVLAADDYDVIGCAVRNRSWRMCGVCHKGLRNLALSV